jgi:Kef-type K+ transport system membrane component KefB
MNYYLVLLPIALVLIISKSLMKLCERLKLPSVLGMLLAGMLVGLIRLIPGQDVLNETSGAGFGFLAQIGVILILFSAGLETDLRQIKKIGLPAVIITLAGVIVPMGLGFLVATLFNGGFSALDTDHILTNVFYGTILSATSVSVSVATLKELKHLNSRVGNTIVAAAIMDDIVGIIVLSIVLAMKNPDAANVVSPWLIILKMLIFFVVIALLASGIARLFKKLDNKYPRHRLVPIFSISLCFLIAYVSERYFDIADITGAYIVGLILSTNPDRPYINSKAEMLGYMIFVPIFFANIGLTTSLSHINMDFLLFGLVFIAAGMIGKVLGCGGAALLCHYTPGDSFRVGVGMMARAEVALVTAQKGVESGIIDTSVMPFIVLLIIITSFVTPIALGYAYRKHPRHLPARKHA